MTERITTEVYRGYRIVLCVDSSPENPRKWGENLGKMICFHGRYNLGDDHNYGSPYDVVMDLTGKEEEDLGRNPNDDLGDGSDYRIVWEPLYLYDHSGITMRTTPFSCPWDSGQVGIIYMTYEEIALQEGLKKSEAAQWRPSKDIIERYEKILVFEVETYDAYIRGDVVGYQVFGPNLEADPVPKSNADDDYWNDDEEGSCWGYYSHEQAIQSAKEFIDGLCDSEGNAE